MLDDLGLRGRAVLITGAGNGIGRAAALRMAAMGATVGVNDLKAEFVEATCAAIAAAGGRGHGVTHIAPGLAMALDFFVDTPRKGSRIVLLVSDGAARIDEQTRDRLRQTFQETGTTLYWIYLRNPTSAPLTEKPDNPNETTTPEYFLNEYFESLDIPYRAFEAENPNAMEKAIAEVERLENLPLPYQERLPRVDLSNSFYAMALVLLLVLMAFRMLEVKTWDA